MGQYSRDEIEQAFRAYWQTGAVGEDWDAWADLFSVDAEYVEHVLGNLKGREAIRAWIKPIMAQYSEIYTVYEWHSVDADAGRVIVYMQNRRDHPSGNGCIDFPGVTILEYAGGGQWKREEDFWAVPTATTAAQTYETARKAFDPDHRQKMTRLDWGHGPAWTRGAGAALSLRRDRSGFIPEDHEARRARTAAPLARQACQIARSASASPGRAASALGRG